MRKPLIKFAAAAVMTCTAPVAVAEPAAPPADEATTADTSSAFAARERYSDSLASMRRELLASPYARDPQVLTHGFYWLEAVEVMAFNSQISPRQDYPAFRIPYPPMEVSWGMTNPDFLYRHAYVDGARTYRIHGKRRGNRWATIQVMKGDFGDSVIETLANVDFDNLKFGPDGSFEFFLSGNPPADTGGKTWVKLDPDYHKSMLTMRETYYDWPREEPLEIHIEVLDRPSGSPVFPDENLLAKRIDDARRWSRAVFDFTMALANTYLDAAGPARRELNRFYGSDEGRSQGGSPLGYWVSMQYEIDPDEALIIEMPVIEARYWGFQLGTVWMQTIDFTYHRSSINGAQAWVDKDGRFRAVLSIADPGVPNWLDPAGVKRGSALLRFYKTASNVVPTVKKVKLADVRRHLPKSTPVVTAEQRRARLAQRERASKRQYHQ